MNSWPVKKSRDLTLIHSPDGTTVVIACDSVGGIGPKPSDTFQTEGRTVAHFAARVPILEVICCGAKPAVIVDTLSVEKEPSAVDMIDEMRSLAVELGLDPDVTVTGSTEDNVVTTTTALGVTVIGIAAPGKFRAGGAQPGDKVLAIGLPLSAPDVKLNPGDPRMPSVSEILKISEMPGVHDLLPVGSRGISYELDVLAKTSGVKFNSSGPGVIDRLSTAGPSTCVLIVTGAETELREQLRQDLPIEVVATVEKLSGHERSPQ